MLKVVCVKLGELYSSYHVNRLFKITKKNLSLPFEFFCYTDNSTNIDSSINIITHIDNDIPIVVHNKLALFSNYVEDCLGDGPRLYFDLDVVFCGLIDSIASYNNGNLTTIQTSWRTPVHMGDPLYQHNLNSSCMTWQRSQSTYQIWHHYLKNKKQYQKQYHMGMDPFLYYEFYLKNQEIIHTFPHGWFRSHLHGMDIALNRKKPGSKNGVYVAEDFAHYQNRFHVVLLNGNTTDQDMINLDKIYSD